MAKVVYVVIRKDGDVDMREFVEKKIISVYEDLDGNDIYARYGTNKATLKKLLEKELSK